MEQKCEWRREVDGIGICALHVLPCVMVMEKGLCECEDGEQDDN